MQLNYLEQIFPRLWYVDILKDNEFNDERNTIMCTTTHLTSYKIRTLFV